MTRTWVFHLETSPGNIPWSLYKEISEDPRVTLAMSYAVGDNDQGYRIVGTTQEMFTKFTYREVQGFVFVRGNLRIPVHREHSFRFNVNTDSADVERRFRSS